MPFVYLLWFRLSRRMCSAVRTSNCNIGFFVLGSILLLAGVTDHSIAQFSDPLAIDYNDVRLTEAVNAMLTYLEGSFGALIMVCAGLGAIISSAFGQYRAALSCLIVALGAFILRSFMDTFLNTDGIQD